LIAGLSIVFNYTFGQTIIDLNVSQPEPINLDLGDDFETNEPLSLDAGNGYVTYTWNDGTQEQTITIDQSGEYWVLVTNEYECSASDTISVVFTATSVVDTDIRPIGVFPNPNNGRFTIQIENGKPTNVQIFTLGGKLVYESEKSKPNLNRINITCPDLPSGVYFIKMKSNDFHAVQKIIVQ